MTITLNNLKKKWRQKIKIWGIILLATFLRKWIPSIFLVDKTFHGNPAIFYILGKFLVGMHFPLYPCINGILNFLIYYLSFSSISHFLHTFLNSYFLNIQCPSQSGFCYKFSFKTSSCLYFLIIFILFTFTTGFILIFLVFHFILSIIYISAVCVFML